MKSIEKQGIDESTVLIGWSLAVKTGKNPTKYEKITRTFFQGGDLILKVLNKVRKKGAYKDFEKDLYGLRITERGYAYVAASVLLGNRAPTKWKEKAKQILYATERPYFNTKLQ